MAYIAKFNKTKECKMILRDLNREDIYYGLDEFDCKYLKIVQTKFGCLNSIQNIPDRVMMELTPFKWNEKKEEFELMDNKWKIMQLNQLESLVISHTFDKYEEFLKS